MRLAFMGTPEFAVPALRALHEAGHDIAAVYSQPPRPAGRGHRLQRSPVHECADRLGIPVITPKTLRRDPAVPRDFAAMALDAAVVAAYGLILPQAMLDAPARGCLNIHASLLPAWRGAGPVQAAILAGDAQTGVTIMQMEAGLDTGPMLLSAAVPIGATTTTADLLETLGTLGARLVLRALAENPVPVPQPVEGTSYAPKLSRADSVINWTRTAAEIDRQIRAFDPWPGTTTMLDGLPLKVLAAIPADGHGRPGTVLDANLTIACGQGAIRLTRIQLPGRQAMPTDAVLRGRKVPIATVLG